MAKRTRKEKAGRKARREAQAAQTNDRNRKARREAPGDYWEYWS